MILYILLTCAWDVLLCNLEKCLVNRGAKVHKITQKTKFPNPKTPLPCVVTSRSIMERHRLCFTKCQHKWQNAYTCIFRNLARIASNALDYGWGRFSGEMRSNQVCAENQYVTRCLEKTKMSNWQLYLAKMAVFTRFCTLFGVGFLQTKRASLANITCYDCKHNVPRWKAWRAAFAILAFYVRFSDVFRSVQK